jgi:hypothetical protein
MPTNDRKWMREYMRKMRKAGKIKHWRQYLKEKLNVNKLQKSRNSKKKKET